MSNEITIFNKDKFDQAMTIAQTLAKSKIVPLSLQQKPEDVFAVLVMGTELGIQPMQALNSINVIQGKPTVSPQLMMAMIRSKLPDPVIHISTNEEKRSVSCKTARTRQDYDAGLYYEAIWDLDRAERMGLTVKDNYKKQAKTMLTWRAVAESCRMTFPDIVMGLYAPEEFQDFDGRQLPSVVSKTESQAMMDQDFPIPEAEKVVGDLYRVQNGKFRGTQLKDIPIEDIAEYREELIKRTTPKKDWENELVSVFGQYLNSIDPTHASAVSF
jgi:hypothetical protein